MHRAAHLLILAALAVRAHGASALAARAHGASALAAAPAVIDDSCEDCALPDGFLFGAGTSAMQTEGATNEGGKGQSVLDYLFEIVKDNPDSPYHIMVAPDGAADSYHRYKEDVAMAKSLKLQVYRFSIDWSRVFPEGNMSNPNPEGVTFYDNLINELVMANIQPMVTMNHFDYPLSVLRKTGGWVSKNIVGAFEEYADFLFATYGDRVKIWTTINEPNYYCMNFAIIPLPGIYEPQPGDDYKCMHHTILAHARVYRLYKRNYFAKQGGRVGAAALTLWATPNSTSYDDIQAAERTNLFSLGAIYSPVVFGDYPEPLRKRVDLYSKLEGLTESRLPVFTAEEKELVKGSADFLSFNAYMANVMADGTKVPKPRYGTIGSDRDAVEVGFSATPGSFKGMFMRCTPLVLREAIMWIRDNYNMPIFITENGWGDESGNDPRDDDRRAAYHSEYLRTLIHTVNEEKVDVVGYLAWSLIDTFEWTARYTRRFGLVYVDIEGGTLNRELKKSAWFFQHIGETRRVPNLSFPTDSGESGVSVAAPCAHAVLAALGLLAWLSAF